MKGGQKCRKVKRLSNVRSSLHVIIKKKKILIFKNVFKIDKKYLITFEAVKRIDKIYVNYR